MCGRCGSTGWLCEAHPDKQWEGAQCCGCGAPGVPCPVCNDFGDGMPRPPAGLQVEIATIGGKKVKNP